MPIDFLQLKRMADKEREISKKYRKELGEMPHKIKGNFLTFLGRQFNPRYKWNRCLKPYWGGFFIRYNSLELMVDPGVNVLGRTGKVGVNLARTNTLFISHAHIDHKNDANVVVELASYRENANLRFLMSQRTMADGAVSQYHLSSSGDDLEKNIILLDTIDEVSLAEGIKLRPIRVIHSIEGAFGFVLDLGKLKVGYTADTGFYETFKTATGEYPVSGHIKSKAVEAPGIFNQTLKNVFSEVDILIFNLNSLDFRKNSAHNLYHATVADAIEVLRDSRVKFCFFDHFNPYGCLGPDYPKQINKFIQESTNKKTELVGLNGKVVNLDKISF